MKPFLGIDLTENKKNEQPNGDCFLIARPSPATAQAFEQSTKKAEAAVQKSRLSRPLRIIQNICGVGGAIVAVGILKALGEVTVTQAYQNAAGLFWIAGGLLLVWAVLRLISSQKANAVLKTEESAHAISSLEGVSSAIYTELSVPAKAREVDLLSFFYKRRGDDIKVREKGMQLASHLNPVYRVWADSENLYIANLDGKYAFPLSSIRGIRTVKKHITLAGWNKDDAINKGFFKQFRLSADQYGRIHCRHYHILEVERSGELWGVWFPCYELPVFEILTGRTAR